MDIEEFTKQVVPRARRSRLEPFREQIHKLKGMGYVDWQIRDWLATQGINVTRQAVQQFLKKENPTTKPASTNTKQIETPSLQDASAEIGRKIHTPADIRKARKKGIDLDQYTDEQKE